LPGCIIQGDQKHKPVMAMAVVTAKTRKQLATDKTKSAVANVAHDAIVLRQSLTITVIN